MINIDDMQEKISQMEIASENEKKLYLRVTVNSTLYVVTKNSLGQIFTNLAAAVKAFNQ